MAALQAKLDAAHERIEELTDEDRLCHPGLANGWISPELSGYGCES